jgi:hypothetical protein
VTFEPNIKTYSYSRWWKGQQLLELTIVDVANDDEVVRAASQIWNIVASRAPQFIPYLIKSTLRWWS